MKRFRLKALSLLALLGIFSCQQQESEPKPSLPQEEKLQYASLSMEASADQLKGITVNVGNDNVRPSLNLDNQEELKVHLYIRRADDPSKQTVDKPLAPSSWDSSLPKEQTQKHKTYHFETVWKRVAGTSGITSRYRMERRNIAIPVSENLMSGDWLVMAMIGDNVGEEGALWTAEQKAFVGDENGTGEVRFTFYTAWHSLRATTVDGSVEFEKVSGMLFRPLSALIRIKITNESAFPIKLHDMLISRADGTSSQADHRYMETLYPQYGMAEAGKYHQGFTHKGYTYASYLPIDKINSMGNTKPMAMEAGDKTILPGRSTRYYMMPVIVEQGENLVPKIVARISNAEAIDVHGNPLSYQDLTLKTSTKQVVAGKVYSATCQIPSSSLLPQLARVAIYNANTREASYSPNIINAENPLFINTWKGIWRERDASDHHGSMVPLNMPATLTDQPHYLNIHERTQQLLAKLPGSGYHMPNSAEWGIVFPRVMGMLSSPESVKFSETESYLAKERSEEIEIAGTKRTYQCQYTHNAGSGIIYAIRLAGHGDQYRSAYRYEFVNNPDGGERIAQVRAVLIGNDYSISDVANEQWWEDRAMIQIVRYFPMATRFVLLKLSATLSGTMIHHMAPGTPLGEGHAGYYLCSDAFEGRLTPGEFPTIATKSRSVYLQAGHTMQVLDEAIGVVNEQLLRDYQYNIPYVVGGNRLYISDESQEATHSIGLIRLFKDQI